MIIVKYFAIISLILVLACEEDSTSTVNDPPKESSLPINFDNLVGNWKAVTQGYENGPGINPQEILYLSLNQDETCLIGYEVTETGWDGSEGNWSILLRGLTVDLEFSRLRIPISRFKVL
jgi:hypothetical protein